MAKQERSLDWLIQHYIKFFAKYGMDERNVRGYHENTWLVQHPDADVGAYLMYLFNNLVSEVGDQVNDPSKKHDALREIYLEIAMYQRKHENQPGNEYWRESLLHYVEQTRVSFPIIHHLKINSGHCCGYCDALDGTLLTYKEVLEIQPLASSQCTRATGCRCRYTSVPVRDSDGQLQSYNQ